MLLYVAFLDRDRMFAAAYDFAGRQRWVARPGPFASVHGFCSCPVLYQDKVILNGDHDGDSYFVALSRADGRVYFLNDKGVKNIVKAGSDFVRVAQNEIGEKCLASPAISHCQIFLRTERHLFCIGTAN